jgi:hypothetical protein
VLIIEPRGRYGGDEELRPVRPRSSIRHRQRIRPIMPILRTKLVFKVSTPTTFSASTISKGITSLQHEFLDDSVKDYVVVITIVDVRDKVFDRLGCSIWE